MTVEVVGAHDVVGSVYDFKTAVFPDRASQFEAMILESVLKSECIDEHFVDTSAFLYRQDEAWFKNILPAEPVEPMEPSLVNDAHQTSQSLAAIEQPLPSKDIEHSVTSVDEFVTSMWPYLKEASKSIGLDPKILLAQTALETGWGKFILKDAQGTSSYNVFNIKSTAGNSGQSVEVKTTEYIDNQPVKLTAAFKSYQSLGQSVQDYLSLIQSSTRYQSAVAHADSPQRYVEALQEAGYATDPNYAHKILSIYHGDELQQALDRNGLV